MVVKRLLVGALLLTIACNQHQPQKAKVNDYGNASINFSLDGKIPVVFSTTEKTKDRISLTDKLTFESHSQPLETDVCIFVDPTHQFQTITGFGGAIVDASAETFAKLPNEKQDEILRAYYDTTDGIGYNMVRTNINSCDFSSDTYNYIQDYDSSLSTFSVKHDEQFRIPLLKKVNEKLNGKMLLFATPWSPPGWMKTNNDVLHGGKLKREYYQLWANYFVKFINTYEKLGLPIWGVSTQNEPMATQRWESCIYSAEDERDFIKNDLGPTLQKNNLKDIKIIGWDHNRDQLFQRASVLLNDPETAKYVWAIGFHWYETWTKSTPLFDNVKRVQEAFPNVNLMFTEGCKEKFDMDSIHNWSLGELYGNNILNDLNNGITAWTDWNILVDQTGGPNHVGNFCFAPLIGNVKTGELFYTNEYYYIGQFSKFIRPGARRVSTSSNRSFLQATSFLNKNGKLAVVVLNTTDNEIAYHLWIDGKWAPAISKPHSISTIVI
ncbi:MAG: glycoside hydrolase family 30 protein [Ginsengibacter sp.]